ncbi:MAG: ATPase, partial [Pseudomonadota bacterium]
MAGKGRTAGKASESAFAVGGPRAPSGALIRVAILAALLMLAIYTAFGVIRLEKGWGNKAGEAGPDAAAQVLAARIDAEIARRGGGLAAGAELLARTPDAPIDAAEAALRAAGPGVQAVGVVTGDIVEAVAGQVEAADWKGAARLTETSGKSLWLGITPGDPRRLYVGRQSGRSVLITAQPLTALPVQAPSHGSAALAGADGRLLLGAGD